MEPVASTSAIRPVAAIGGGDARSILQDGRILAAQVLDAPDEGRLMLALGRHRVPAETNLRLEEGESFLVRVEGSGEAALLKVLGVGDPVVERLLDALRRVIGEGRPVGELLADLAATLRAESARPGGALAELRTLLADLEGQAMGPKAAGADLAGLFERSGYRYEALLARFAEAAPTAKELRALRANFKARLLEALDSLEDGPARRAVDHVLSSLEAEQLLNVARRASGDPLVFSFPFPDPAGWTTATLFVSEREDREEGEGESGGPAAPETLTLAIRFSRLGPVRVDLALTETQLDIRVFVEEEALAARVRSDTEELLSRLDDGRRSVRLFIRAATAEELEPGAHPLDIEFLRRHHLMDLRG
ncbi:MAG TPA: hypothetical protein ENJ09_13475 [Planctomycetes bacterium]|nr:hypothetical protein [Planctomycetota bacterium]